MSKTTRLGFKMIKVKLLLITVCLLFVVNANSSAAPAGLVAEWNFDEGQGQSVVDSSGNGHDGQVSGATWEKQGGGFAIALDGLDDYVDCGTLPITGPITIETWIKPTRKANGLSCVMGESLSSYLLSYYNTEVCDFYLADGSNSVRGNVTLGQWNHVVVTFDGKNMTEWVNGRLTLSKESKYTSYKTAGIFMIGTKGQPSVPHFKGLLDKARVYNRALSAEEAIAHFKGEAAQYGFDPAWFSRVKAIPHYYFDRGELVVEADYKGLQPLKGKAKLEVSLVSRTKPKKAIYRQAVDKLPELGVVEVKVPVSKLVKGDYVIRVALQDGKGARPVEEIAFSYPMKPSPVPAPAASVVPPLPAESKPAPFDVKVGRGGGFEVAINGGSYPFQSRISWPNGDFNRLTAGDAAYDKGEKSWKVSTQDSDKDRYTVDASGDSYKVRRDLQVFHTHIYIKDTYTNTTDKDLGLLIYNEMPVKQGQLTESRLSGHEQWGRKSEMTYPDYNPNLFLTDANAGMGIVPMDDVYMVQGVPYADWEGAAGICTEKFALAPESSYTLEWAVYPTGSKDYYDYINTYRKVEGRTATVEGAPGFISFGPMNRRQVPDKDFFEKRNVKIGVVSCLSRTADDPQVSIEGIEFVDFPKEMQLCKGQAAAFHKLYPEKKIIFHIAHSIYMTNKPDRFPDSKVITADGRHGLWGASEPYVSKQRQQEGWTWWAYYPVPGNSFHDAMMKSVDVMMDDMGFDGGFMDGFMAGYGGHWSYDTDVRWDGHSAEIDPGTKTITRKMNSVILLSQPSLVEYARKIRDKGGVVIANNNIYTRTLCNEKYIIFDNECASGPELHMAPSVTVLCTPNLNSYQEMYIDMLDKLSWGELFVSYNDRINLDYPSMAAKQYPMTFEEIRSGMVKGKERIVTMNSGVYGWRGKNDLHMVYKFDERGAGVSNSFNTTVDTAGVRTELKFKKNESAVVEPIPVNLEAKSPVNVRVLQYTGHSLKMLLNGQCEATLSMFVGTSYPDKRDGVFTDGGINPSVIGAGDDYRVTIGGKGSIIKDSDGCLTVPLKLNGQTGLLIERVGK